MYRQGVLHSSVAEVVSGSDVAASARGLMFQPNTKALRGLGVGAQVLWLTRSGAVLLCRIMAGSKAYLFVSGHQRFLGRE